MLGYGTDVCGFPVDLFVHSLEYGRELLAYDPV